MTRASSLAATFAFAAAFASLVPRLCDACESVYETPFDLYERAQVVATVKVMSAPADWRGPATFAVRQVLKGRPGPSIAIAREAHVRCRPALVRGAIALVFLDARQRILDDYVGYLEVAEGDATVASLAAYARASDALSRAASLVDTATAGGQALAERQMALAAAHFLAERPDLAARLAPVERERLFVAMNSADRGTTLLPVLLARLRDRRIVPMLEAAPWGTKALATLVLAERFESVKDPEELARAIEGGPSPQEATRVAALERCERLAGRQLERLSVYSRGVSEDRWKRLAAACRRALSR